MPNLLSDLVTRAIEGSLDVAAKARMQLKGAKRLLNRASAKAGVPLAVNDGGRPVWPREVAAKEAPAPVAKVEKVEKPPAPLPVPVRQGLVVETAGPSLETWRKQREAAPDTESQASEGGETTKGLDSPDH